jgi:hypothetical protein
VVRNTVSDTRDHTIAFRVSSSERARIDRLASGAAVTPSEFARRAVFDSLDVGTSAREQGQEQGREEAQALISELKDELSRTRQQLAQSEAAGREFYRELIRAPDQLIGTARHLVAGVPGAQVSLTLYWSRIPHHDRCKIVPILAAVVADEVGLAMARLRTTEDDLDWGLAMLMRVLVLMDALTPESGRGYLSTPSRRPEWAPLEAACREAHDTLQIRTEALQRRDRLVADDVALADMAVNAGLAHAERDRGGLIAAPLGLLTAEPWGANGRNEDKEDTKSPAETGDPLVPQEVSTSSGWISV